MVDGKSNIKSNSSTEMSASSVYVLLIESFNVILPLLFALFLSLMIFFERWLLYSINVDYIDFIFAQWQIGNSA